MTVFLAGLAVIYGVCVGLFLALFNYDRIAVTVLGAIGAPGYEDARRIAGMIYAHPGEWKRDKFGHMTNEAFGTIRYADRPFCSLSRAWSSAIGHRPGSSGAYWLMLRTGISAELSARLCRDRR